MQRYVSQPLAVPHSPWVRADLEFEGVEHDGATFLVYLFLNNPEADEHTPREASEHYAGYMTVFAHGDCWGDAGHCEVGSQVNPFDRRPPHPLVPFNATLEITEALRALEGPDEVTVTVLAFNKADDEDGVLRFKQLSLLTYE
jgi:tyrosinase